MANKIEKVTVVSLDNPEWNAVWKRPEYEKDMAEIGVSDWAGYMLDRLFEDAADMTRREIDFLVESPALTSASFSLEDGHVKIRIERQGGA